MQIECQECGEWVEDTFNDKVEHMYYAHTDGFILAWLTSVQPANARELGQRVARYFQDA